MTVREEGLRSVGYGRQSIDASDEAAVLEVLRGDWLTQGPAVRRFESALAETTGARYAAACSSGTAALHLALAALDIGPGCHVVTSANTFLASATTALACGADVSFVDVEPRTWNLDVEALEEVLNTRDVDAVVAVHFAGQPCAMDALLVLQRRFGFALVEDACHALGASYWADGRRFRVGEHPAVDATVLSFHPVKALTTGEGGAVLTHDERLDARVRRLREHGVDRESDCRPFPDSTESPPWFAPLEELGFNYRMPDMNAALGASQVRRLPAFLRRRRELAARYDEVLEGFSKPVFTDEHAWHLYALHVPAADRDPLMSFLRERGITTQVHYYPVPLQPLFRRLLDSADFPNAEQHARTTISLPLFPALSDEDQQRVVTALEEWRGSHE